jgi:hypothetical protein
MEARLNNHCCRGKAVSIIYSESGSAEYCSGNTTVSTKVATTLRMDRKRIPKRTLQYKPKGTEA